MQTNPPQVESVSAATVVGDSRDQSVDPPTPLTHVTPAEAAGLDIEPKQRVALMVLSLGRSKVEAATAAGVSRATLYRWLTDDAGFQAAINAWQNDVRSTAQAQLLAATGDAVATVLKSIRGGNAALAWKMLTSQGVTKMAKPGSTDADDIRYRRSVTQKKKDLADLKERRQLEEQELTGGLY